MHDVVRQELSPSAALAAFVERIRAVAPRQDMHTRTWTRLPEVGTAIVLCRENGVGHLVAVGPGTRARSRTVTGIPFHVRIELRPGAASALLGASVHELGDRAIDLADLWGREATGPMRALSNETLDARTAHTALEKLLRDRVRRVGERTLIDRVETVRRVTTLAPTRSEHVGTWARRVGLSERSLRRLFREEIGLSPWRYARIVRLRRAIARAGAQPWSAIAAELGFSDASHLAAEFRAFVGVAPTEFLRAACSPLCGSATSPARPRGERSHD
jgi:AraC-like DNA-binding protein